MSTDTQSTSPDLGPVRAFNVLFSALWGHEPFPWQSMLAERLADRAWPGALDLPTASGKTACIDIALYALAYQACRPLVERTAPRRIWFVVDRRIVVDEAYERAETIARKLSEAKDGSLRDIADRLRQLSGTGRPLAVARLRGGVFRDDGWARIPSQPAVITSTVDQLGSRLLFRGYGRSNLTAPIFAGLAANDSLILLDEAHCSVPFLQTLRAVEAYRGPRWAEEPLALPFHFTVLSATPPADIPPDAVFPGPARARALDHPVLQQRLRASKVAELVTVKTGQGRSDESFIETVTERVKGFLSQGRQRIVAFANRVVTARAIAESLQQIASNAAHVQLLTGRIRPVERDSLIERWKPLLKAASPSQPDRPIVLVSTQCLEVGADFSFDALVTEAASLDALRQRFGRLYRMGRPDAQAGAPDAIILIREPDADATKAEADAIYGTAITATWAVLNDLAEGGKVDFGVEALHEQLAGVEDLTPCLAPAGEAPVLLPAHVDLLCQTAPPPHPEPEISLFLHGKERGTPEVQVVWRADLDPEDTNGWAEMVALCPPVSGEMLSVPLYRLRSFLRNGAAPEDGGDVEGGTEAPETGDHRKPCVIWRGRERTRVERDPVKIAPNDVVVVPSAYGIGSLGQSGIIDGLGQDGLDLWERSLEGANRPPALRLHRALLGRWMKWPPIAALLELVDDPDLDPDALREALEAVETNQSAVHDDLAPPPDWWRRAVRVLLSADPPGYRVEQYPGQGLVLTARGRLLARDSEDDRYADDDDLTSAAGIEVSLNEHTILVRRTVEQIAERCVDQGLRDTLAVSAAWHDAGKLDPRFQVVLHHGDELALMVGGEPLAKSAYIPASPARRRAIRDVAGLPEGFRHEMLSLQLAERGIPGAADLLLHLIASHHGHARPHAPVVEDPAPPAVQGSVHGLELSLTQEARATISPAHRLDSGIAERFWRLVRRHGWWGLAYLEALLRLGDWYASGLQLKAGAPANGQPEPVAAGGAK